MEDWQKLGVITMHQDGKSVREIGKRLNLPKSTVHDFISQKYDTHNALQNRISKPEGTKRVLCVSDSHAGSRVGLTPPSWMFQDVPSTKSHMLNLRDMQEEMWWWWVDTIKEIGPVDVLIHCGDVIDGKADKDGSCGLITASMNEQVDIACEVFDMVKADSKFVVYGTGYHTASKGEDFEKVFADKMGASIDGRLWIDVNGVLFDVRHAIGSSSVPQGRANSLSKEWVWNTFWKEKGMQKHSDIILRGHVHYHTEVSNCHFKAMSLPSLQGPKTRFGERICSGTVDFGVVVFDVPKEASLQDVTYKVYNKNLVSFEPDVYFA